jgi:hypothetical protein
MFEIKAVCLNEVMHKYFVTSSGDFFKQINETSAVKGKVVPVLN